MVRRCDESQGIAGEGEKILGTEPLLSAAELVPSEQNFFGRVTDPTDELLDFQKKIFGQRVTFQNKTLDVE